MPDQVFYGSVQESESVQALSLLAGSEMTVNGGFDSGTDGWIPFAGAILSSEAGGQSGNCLQVKCDAIGTINALTYQHHVTVVGKAYMVTLYCKKGTAEGYLARVGLSAAMSEYASFSGADAGWVQKTVVFIATTIQTTVTLYANSSADHANEYSLYDGVSFKELPLNVYGDIYLSGNARINVPSFANNAAAIAGGLIVGQFYLITGGDIVGIVH